MSVAAICFGAYLAVTLLAAGALSVRWHRLNAKDTWKDKLSGANEVMVGYALSAALWPVAWIFFIPDAMKAFGEWWCRRPPKVEPPYKAPVDPKSYRESP